MSIPTPKVRAVQAKSVSAADLLAGATKKGKASNHLVYVGEAGLYVHFCRRLFGGVTFVGELRGGLSGRLRYDLFLQIDPFASDQELVTS